MALTGIPARWLTSTTLCCVLLSGARAADGPDALDQAASAVSHARRTMQRRHEPATILAALDAAAASLEDIVAPERPELVSVGAGAGETESSQAGEENKRRLEAWRSACGTWRKRRERLLARWVRLLGQALIIRRIEGGSLANVHSAVNRRGLTLLSMTGREDAARAITSTLENEWIHISRLTAADPMAVHALEDLHKVGSPHAFDWLRRTFVGKERDLVASVPTSGIRRQGTRELDLHPPDLPVLAMQAIARHEDMPGRMRHAMVRDLLAAYVPLERRAAGGADVARWERMRIAVLHATLMQAGEPTDETGEVLTTMADLARWFRQHRSPRGEPWAE